MKVEEVKRSIEEDLKEVSDLKTLNDLRVKITNKDDVITAEVLA